MRRKACWALLLVFGSEICSAGADEATLLPAGAVEKAIHGNLALEIARHELEVAEGQAIGASAPINPELTAAFEGLPRWRWEPGTAGQTFAADQTVEAFGKRALRRTSAGAQLDADRARYRVLEREVARRVKQAYWTLSLSRDLRNFGEENLKFQQRFLGLVQDRFQTGGAKLADLARAKLEVARASNELLIATKAVKDAEAELNRVLGQDLLQGVPTVQHLAEPSIRLSEDELVRRALERRPEQSLVAALDRGAKADLGLAERLLWAPDVKAGVQLERRKSVDGSDGWGAHGGLAFPLWYRYSGERRAAQAKLGSLATQKLDLEQSIRLEVRKAFLEVDLSREQVEIFRQAIDQATEAARLAEQQYREGDSDLLVATQARRDLVSATKDLLTELRDYWTNLAALEQAVGEDLGGS